MELSRDGVFAAAKLFIGVNAVPTASDATHQPGTTGGLIIFIVLTVIEFLLRRFLASPTWQRIVSKTSRTGAFPPSESKDKDNGRPEDGGPSDGTGV